MVAISHNHGAVICEQYFGPITGEKFGNVVKVTFPQAFEKCQDKCESKTFLMDGCHRQNSKAARIQIEKVGAKIFSIPERSPDLNPIENFFILSKKNCNLRLCLSK